MMLARKPQPRIIGIPEAPHGDVTYGRIDNSWEPATPEAPRDGDIYGRKNGEWVKLDVISAADFNAKYSEFYDWVMAKFITIGALNAGFASTQAVTDKINNNNNAFVVPHINAVVGLGGVYVHTMNMPLAGDPGWIDGMWDAGSAVMTGFWGGPQGYVHTARFRWMQQYIPAYGGWVGVGVA